MSDLFAHKPMSVMTLSALPGIVILGLDITIVSYQFNERHSRTESYIGHCKDSEGNEIILHNEIEPSHASCEAAGGVSDGTILILQCHRP